VAILRDRLAAIGLGDSIALCSESEQPIPPDVERLGKTLDDAASADLLINLSYLAHGDVLSRFRRTALIDIDPGLLQVWLSEGQLSLARHDVYYTIGETVGQPGALFSSGGIEWQYTPPAVSLDAWPVALPPPAKAPFTTVSSWSSSDEWVLHGEQSYRNDKRSGFEPFFALPRKTRQPLMLALCQAVKANSSLELESDEAAEKAALERLGWRVTHAYGVAGTPASYQRFIQQSRGEFSCCKPSCVRLQNAWISDRTLCYLASGRPAVVQHTGPSRFLPDAAGIFRFRDIDEAAKYLDMAAEDYPRQSQQARALAQEFFDARKVAKSVVERAI
jgi:hypothetical protein